MNKTQLASKFGITKSGLATILDSKTRWNMANAEFEGKGLDDRKRLKTSPYDAYQACTNQFFS